MPQPKTELMKKSCVVCGKPFLVCPPGKTSRYCTSPYESLYCSRPCRHAGRYRKGAICHDLTIPQAAYIAGFLDGEGSIMIINQSHSRIGIRVTFSNCNMDVMNWLKTVTGVGVNVVHKPTAEKHSTAYTLSFNYAACDLLKQIIPYLVIKKTQAQLAIDFATRQSIPAQKADKTWQLEMKATMQALNGRGINRPIPI